MQVNHEFAFEECANQFGFVFDLWGDTDSLASLAPLINGLRLFFLKKIIFYGKSYAASFPNLQNWFWTSATRIEGGNITLLDGQVPNCSLN